MKVCHYEKKWSGPIINCSNAIHVYGKSVRVWARVRVGAAHSMVLLLVTANWHVILSLRVPMLIFWVRIKYKTLIFSKICETEGKRSNPDQSNKLALTF